MRRAALAATAWLWAGSAWANCVDINADATALLEQIVHIDAVRARAIEADRPWPDVASLTALHGIGRSRIGDILAEGIACVGVRVEPGERPIIEGIATVLDADTFIVAEARIRLIGIDAPEGRQLCHLEDHDWPCGQVATAAVYDLVGNEPVACAVYGHDRWARALAVCYQNGVNLNAEIVRSGWALAWYPETAAVLGPTFEAAQDEAVSKAAGVWQGAFMDPWAWRRQTN